MVQKFTEATLLQDQADGDYIINMTVKMEKQKLQIEIITFFFI